MKEFFPGQEAKLDKTTDGLVEDLVEYGIEEETAKILAEKFPTLSQRNSTFYQTIEAGIGLERLRKTTEGKTPAALASDYMKWKTYEERDEGFKNGTVLEFLSWDVLPDEVGTKLIECQNEETLNELFRQAAEAVKKAKKEIEKELA